MISRDANKICDNIKEKSYFDKKWFFVGSTVSSDPAKPVSTLDTGSALLRLQLFTRDRKLFFASKDLKSSGKINKTIIYSYI